MGNQYLTFTLADTLYAADVFRVREVLPYSPPQALPSYNPIIEGLIRFRGMSIPVISLRQRFGLERVEAAKETRIIVLELKSLQGDSAPPLTFGAIADSVNEVLDLEEPGIEKPPEIGKGLSSEFIEGIGRKGSRFVIILNVDKIFSPSEIAEMESAIASPAGGQACGEGGYGQ